MVGARAAVELARAPAEMRDGEPPAALQGVPCQGARIVAVGPALQPVKQHELRAGARVAAEVDVDEVAVGAIPALAPQRRARRRKQRRHDGLQMPAGQPPGRCEAQCSSFGGASPGAGSGCAGAGEAWCTIMRQPAAVRRYTLVAMTAACARASPATLKFSCTLCTAIIMPLTATCCEMCTRGPVPPAKILAQLSRTWSWPARRGPPGCTQTISSSSDQTAIMPSRSARSSAS